MFLLQCQYSYAFLLRGPAVVDTASSNTDCCLHGLFSCLGPAASLPLKDPKISRQRTDKSEYITVE